MTTRIIPCEGFDESCALHNGAEHSQKAVVAAYVRWSRAAVQIRTGRRERGELECRMSIDRDDVAERQARVDRMINEFREAQSRRFRKPNDKVVESKPGANTKAPLTGSATSQ